MLNRKLKEFRVLDMRRRKDSKRSERKRNCEQCGAIPRSEGTGGARPSRRILSPQSLLKILKARPPRKIQYEHELNRLKI